MISLDSFVAAIANIPVGWFVEKTGYRGEIIIFGSIGTLLAHTIYALAPDCDQCWESKAPLIIMGVTYSIYSVILFPSIAYYVEPNMMGKAYGINTVFNNFVRVGVTPLLGWV